MLAMKSPVAIKDVSSRSIELDFLRGVAILLVMGTHFSYYPTDFWLLTQVDDFLKRVGGVGVNLFFTLSGYLVGGLLLMEYRRTGTLNPGKFLARRALKIWPPLYALVIFHALLGRHELSTFFWQNLLHVQNYFGTSIAQTWSLAVEEHFYIFLAIMLSLMVGRSSKVILSVVIFICLLALIARSVAVQQGYLDAAFRQTQFRVDSLLYGVALAVVKIFHPEQFQRLASKKLLLIASAMMLFLFVNWSSENALIERSIGYAIQGMGFALLVVLTCSYSGELVRSRWYKLVAWIGVYSYGIYLWHSLALEPGRRLIALIQAQHISSLVAWPCVLLFQCVLACVTGYIMTRLVELPSLKLRDRLFPAHI